MTAKRWVLRPETPGDRDGITAVVEAAFGQPDEARLVERLRADGDAALSLVTEREGVILGHVLFSPMTAPVRALGLAPVSVAPDCQGQGIGTALIRAGLERAALDGWQAAFVLGEPAYYERFGFRADRAKPFESAYSGPYFMVVDLVGGALENQAGPVAYAPAFDRLG